MARTKQCIICAAFIAVLTPVVAAAQENAPSSAEMERMERLRNETEERVDALERSLYDENELALRRLEIVEQRVDAAADQLDRSLLIIALSALLAFLFIANTLRVQQKLSSERVARAVREADIVVRDIRRELARPQMEHLRLGHLLRQSMRQLRDSEGQVPGHVMAEIRKACKDRYLPVFMHYMATALIAEHEGKWRDAAMMLDKLRDIHESDVDVLLHLSHVHKNIAAVAADKEERSRHLRLSRQYYAHFAVVVRADELATETQVLETERISAPVPPPRPIQEAITQTPPIPAAAKKETPAPPKAEITKPAVVPPSPPPSPTKSTPPPISPAPVVAPKAAEAAKPAVVPPGPPPAPTKSPPPPILAAVKKETPAPPKAEITKPAVVPPSPSPAPTKSTPPPILAAAKKEIPAPPKAEITKPAVVSSPPPAPIKPTPPPISPAPVVAPKAAEAVKPAVVPPGPTKSAARKEDFKRWLRSTQESVRQGAASSFSSVRNIIKKFAGSEGEAGLPLLPIPPLSDIPAQINGPELSMWREIRKGDLGMLAADGAKSLRQRNRRIDAALAHYAQAQSHKTNKTLYYNWGLAMLAKALHMPQKKRAAFFNAAVDKFLAGNVVHPHYFDFHLASLYAIMGDDAECRKWLRVAAESDTLDVDTLRHAPDFDRMRKTEWFGEFLDG